MAVRTSQIVDACGRPLVVNQAYEGAAHSHRTKGWSAPNTGPNGALLSARQTLVNRSRAGHRNSPFIHGAIESGVVTEIGTGIRPRSTCADETYAKAANELWLEVCEQVDPENILDFYGIQEQMNRARRSSGEVFLRLRPRPFSSKLALPFQLQVLESDHVPDNYEKELKNGNHIKAGIEFNRRGQRVAYWVYPYHPQDGFKKNFGKLVRVPARQMIHHYMPTRPGQLRGEPDAVQSLLKEHTFNSYDDAELQRKRSRAPYTGFIYREDVPGHHTDEEEYDPVTGDILDESMPGSRVMPGTLLTGLPGEKIDMFDGDNTGQGYADFMRWQSRLIARGLNTPYEIMTGDWTGVNDRLVRAVLHEYRRAIEMIQEHCTKFQVCRTAWGWFNDYGVLTGKLPAKDYAENRHGYLKSDWLPQAHPYMHPQQDIKARIDAIDNDLSTVELEANRLGKTGDEILVENMRHRQRRKQLEKQFELEGAE